MDVLNSLPALLLGFLGAGHCIGMCGGIMSALAMNTGSAVAAKPPMRFILFYNVGRISSYAFMGALAAGVVGWLPASGFPLARTFAGVVLILMGFYVADWWRAITVLERWGGHFWPLLKPLSSRFIPIQNSASAWVVGMVWGWLPCGLVYSALAYATAQHTVLNGALVMLFFGAGTLPALVFSGVILTKVRGVLSLSWIKTLLGCAYIIFGLWTIIIAWQHAGHAEHHGGHHDHELHHSHELDSHELDSHELDGHELDNHELDNHELHHDHGMMDDESAAHDSTPNQGEHHSMDHSNHH